MRLLNTENYELKDIRQKVEYAILSHRWYEEEITFGSLDAAQLRDSQQKSPQLDKIRGSCAQAKEAGLEWVWIDSCCINRNSSEELRRSISSMFDWYQNAAVCYTYLSDVIGSETSNDHFEPQNNEDRKYSEWFERGTRAELATEISRITGIAAMYLNGTDDFRNANIATKLSWQAGRKTTEVEDTAYSLIGVLGVQLMAMYGEGRQAFQRLQEEAIKTQVDESIFAWTTPAGSLPNHNRPWASDQWGLLAPSPDCFMKSGDITINGPSRSRPSGGISIIAGGVQFPMAMKDRETVPQWVGFVSVFVPPFLGLAIFLAVGTHLHRKRKEFPLTLNCWRKDQVGKLKPIQIFITRDSDSTGDLVWRRCNCEELGLGKRVPRNDQVLDIKILQPSGIRWPIRL
ncbi:hypothetical protein ACMFMF_008563 [Clarireedia jacksonii]